MTTIPITTMTTILQTAQALINTQEISRAKSIGYAGATHYVLSNPNTKLVVTKP